MNTNTLHFPPLAATHITVWEDSFSLWVQFPSSPDSMADADVLKEVNAVIERMISIGFRPDSDMELVGWTEEDIGYTRKERRDYLDTYDDLPEFVRWTRRFSRGDDRINISYRNVPECQTCLGFGSTDNGKKCTDC